MKVIDTKIADVKIVEPTVFSDDRGFFLETFQDRKYKELLNIEEDFVQDNYSRSSQGVLRGLHFQKTRPQGKLVRVVKGTVFDVAVDIRADSKTFGHWVGVELTAENKRQLWIPPGLAHGFLVMSESADFEYKCTDYYYPDDEGCLMWNDEDINIDWPIKNVLLSEKDKQGMTLKEIGL